MTEYLIYSCSVQEKELKDKIKNSINYEKELTDKIKNSINYEFKKVTSNNNCDISNSNNNNNTQQKTPSSTTPTPTSTSSQRRKKSRTVFTKRQILKLESMFYAKRYLSNTDRIELSKSLALSENQVKVWFQNRRNKWKRDMAFKLECAKFNSEQVIPDIDEFSNNYFDVRANHLPPQQQNNLLLSDCCYGDTSLLVPSAENNAIRCYTQLK